MSSASKNRQKGQTLIIIVMIMILALFIGITASSRFIKTLRNISASDNSTKALAVAEAAVERILLIPSDTLAEYIDNNNCGSDCYLEITDVTGQLLTATVTLGFVGNSTDSYPLTITEDEASAVSLQGYPTGRSVNVCWNGTTSVAGYYIFEGGSTIQATPFAYNAVLTSYNDNGFDTAAANFGFENCFSVTTSDTPRLLRLRSFYGKSEVEALPEAGYSIPIQGIKIISVGKAGDATRTVTVIKSTAYAPSYFDFSLYQKSWEDSLSN